MYYALSRPNRVNKLISVDIAPTQRPIATTFNNYIDLMSRMTKEEKFKTRLEVDKYLATEIQDKGIRQFLCMNLKQDPSSKIFTFELNFEVLRKFLKEIASFPINLNSIKPFENPFMLLYGAKSNYVELPAMDIKIKQLFPNVKYSLLNTGHWVKKCFPSFLFKFKLVFRIVSHRKHLSPY